MSVRVTAVTGKAALYDSVTGVAFGPVFDSHDDANQFLEHLLQIGERDPRVIPAADLAQLKAEWEGHAA